MTEQVNIPKKKKSKWKLIVLILISILALSSFFLYRNLNQMLSVALLKTFNSNLISDVYELKFEKLNVNIFEGSIAVKNVSFQKRDNPLQNYPYINSTIKLKTEELRLKDVEILALLKEGKLELKEIYIQKPDIELILDGEKSVLFPYKDTLNVIKDSRKKRAIVGFRLQKFHLQSANFHGINKNKENEFEIKDFSISLNDILIDQQTGKDLIICKLFELNIGETKADLKNSPVQHARFSSFSINLESLQIQKSIDTLLYTFKDLNTNLAGLDIQTADSINHISLGSINVSYKNKSLKLNKLKFKPNISDAEIQKKFKYQKVNFSAAVGKIEINNINFDSLIYYRKIYIDKIFIDSAVVHVFKDKLKPIDTNRFPEYFGQDIRKIPIPVQIKEVTASNITLYNTERKPDSSFAKVSINRGKAQLLNITNLSTANDFVMKANAFIDNKVPFNVTLNFSYTKPQFVFKGNFKKFDLIDLNHLIQSYTPAKITACKVDGVTFSGLAEQKYANGTMKFLYHGLLVDLELKKQKKWANSAISFAANSILPASNPANKDNPPREVKFHADRDMNKGFINIILKSVLTGLKETFYMSKENKKTHQSKLKKNKNRDK